MLTKKARFTRQEFTAFLSQKNLFVVYNKLGTLKYSTNENTRFSVVTSSKQEKKAVKRNKLRRRIYALIQQQKPNLSGVVYTSKHSFSMEYDEIKELFNDLLAKSKKNSK